MINRLAIIGVGLIGSSLSLALKKGGKVKHVVGYGRNLDNLKKGVELGVLDSFQESIANAVKDADVVVLAVPLGAMQSVFGELKNIISANSVITDVGSAKGSVIEAARAALGQQFSQFVPGHPIAGGENNGVEAGDAELFQNRRVILTPLEQTSKQACKIIEDMWINCGAHIETLEVEHHDKVLAATSHLPHMLAYTLVHLLSNMNDKEEIFKYAAGGFRDFTRIASSDPVMWRDVCLSNGDTLVKMIKQYQQELGQVCEAIEDKNADQLLDLFGRAKANRDAVIGHC